MRETDRQSITICDTNDRQRTDRTDRHLGTDPRRGPCPGASFAAGSWIRLAKPFGTKQPNEGDSEIGPLAARGPPHPAYGRLVVSCRTFHGLCRARGKPVPGLDPSALEIAELYRERWRIELLFRFVKSHMGRSVTAWDEAACVDRTLALLFILSFRPTACGSRPVTLNATQTVTAHFDIQSEVCVSPNMSDPTSGLCPSRPRQTVCWSWGRTRVPDAMR